VLPNARHTAIMRRTVCEFDLLSSCASVNSFILTYLKNYSLTDKTPHEKYLVA